MADVVTDGAEVGGGDAAASIPEPAEPPRSRPAPVPPAASGPPPFPRRMVNAIVAAAVGLVLLTVVINRVASSASPSTTTPTTEVHQVVGGTAPPPDANQLHASLRSLLDLITLHGQRASAFSLTDAATGKTVSLRSLQGRVVVLTFADADCKDICPVLGAELHAAAGDLAKTKVPVDFVTVNTDPLATSPKDATILRQPLLSSIPGWTFLTGSVAQLNGVWKSYGISITAERASKTVTHNELLYFISPRGALEWSALPFADQSANGSYSLAAPVVDRFGAGIARYASELAK